MTSLSIFHPHGALTLKANPFGKDVANLELFQALARHGGLEQLDVLSFQQVPDQEVSAALLGEGGGATRVVSGPALAMSSPIASGALFRGQPYLDELAYLRRRVAGDAAFSLIGMVHTLAPPAVRQMIATVATAPIHPWDALICTSPSVRQSIDEMLDRWGEDLAARTGGSPPPKPTLPLIPLGVDGQRFADLADRPDVRAQRRAQLGLAQNDILVLWVGRLSFFEKAYPQAMFRACQAAAKASGAGVHFAMAGWFPQEKDLDLFQEDARNHAPDVQMHFLDGNDRALVGELWAAGDIFLSLVDNIQETFGITPLEAMAAGLPVVASDWDGYRSTIRDGVEGFLIPTLGGPLNGIGASIGQRHIFEAESYQAYVGAVAQHTAVDVERCAQALHRLICDPELRRRMGAAGRERVRSHFDWPVVARQVTALVEDLGRIRPAAGALPAGMRHPIKGDPFVDFRHFASQTLTLETPLRRAAGSSVEQIDADTAVRLDGAFAGWRGTTEDARQVLSLLAEAEPRTVRDILLSFPAARRRNVELGLVWMAKQGYLDWRGDIAAAP